MKGSEMHYGIEYNDLNAAESGELKMITIDDCSDFKGEIFKGWNSLTIVVAANTKAKEQKRLF